MTRPFLRLRLLAPALLLLAADGLGAQRPTSPAQAKQVPTTTQDKAATLAADAPMTTVEGNTFLAPAGWTVTVRGPATILEPPEGDSHIALVDVRAADADAAVAAAWAAYRPDARWPLTVTTDAPDRDGWDHIKSYSYQTSPNERRDVGVTARQAGGVWTVSIYDMLSAVGEKRAAQVSLILGRLLPRGYARESFVGKKANRLDAARIAELMTFVETARKELDVPGVAFGVVQDGKVVFSGGSGVRELGSTEPVDGNTLFMIASNTKALTTLMLARLVDQGKFTWDTPVMTLYPSFRLGDEATARQVLVKHLICACTGLPRQDYEWLFEFKDRTPESTMALLGTIQPTSKFGEMFQYSNLLAGAAGFVGGHVRYPGLELGAAYDRAMQTLVFDPLGMKATTLEFARALRGNHATAHSLDIDGKPVIAVQGVNESIIPLRPAGGAWSSVNDLLKYVSMELAEGALPDGRRYIGRDALLARRATQVPIGKDDTYGMGLMVNTRYGVPVVHHGGDMIGYHSDMIWLPQNGIGAVILTNSDPGGVIRNAFRRKLLELAFDGRPEADDNVASAAKAMFAEIAADRKLMTVPADPVEAGKLARLYDNPALGQIAVSHVGAATVFDFGEWKSEVASRRNPDGSVSFLTIVPGMDGFEFVVGATQDGKRALVVRDAQHEYTFVEK